MCPSDFSILPSTNREVKLLLYVKTNIIFYANFEIKSLIKSLKFSHTFTQTGRNAVYFGTHEYRYTGGYHAARDIHSNKYISDMFKFVSSKFPQLMLNSCLINFYPEKYSSIPFHSDDEPCIDPNSWILTLSLGCDRLMTFKSVNGDYSDEVLLTHGQLILFSRESQDLFMHGILPEVTCSAVNNLFISQRVSATFRKILAPT